MKLFTLGDIIDALEKCDQKKSVIFDFPELVPTSFDSWRGIYSELALGFDCGYSAERPSVASLLEKAKSADGGIFQGWKGGTYEMNRQTKVWVNNPGCCDHLRICDAVEDEYCVTLKTIKCDD